MTEDDTLLLDELEVLEAELCARSLPAFVQKAWPILEADAPLRWNWHLDLICSELEKITRGENGRLLINVPPGTMKPVSCEEVVTTAAGPKKLGDIVVGDRVLTHLGRFMPVTAVHEQGELDVVRVSAFSGRSVVAAPDHPFLTPLGWVPAGELKAGDLVGRPHRREALDVGAAMPAEEARLLGYLVGDGCLSHVSHGFVNADREVLDDFIRCAAAMGFVTVEKTHPNPRMKARFVRLKSCLGRWNWRRDGEPPVYTWLRRHGLFASTSYTKRIPTAVFAGGEETIQNFMGAYWSSDGQVYVRHKGAKLGLGANACTVSKDLAHDVQYALELLNIDARVRRRDQPMRTARQGGDRYAYYVVETTRASEVVKFAGMPGLCSRKSVLAGLGSKGFGPCMYPDEVVSVTPAGKAPCRCLTVDGDRSFVAGGMAVHNTLLVAVFWPAWEWASKPQMKYLSASYGMERSTDSARKVRDIVSSEWFRRSFRVLLRADQEAKTYFMNTAGGWYMATSTDGRATGEHPDRRIIDDPHNAKQARSDVERKRALEWHAQTLSTRGASKNAAEVVIMQRLHERDLSGYILDKGTYRHVMLPMRFEPDRKSPGDKRTSPGELLWPELFPEDKVRALELVLGQYGVAGQFAQRPAPAGGGLFKREWFKWADARPARVSQRVRAWDAAATEGAGCFTAGALVSDAGPNVSPRFYVEDMQRGQWGSFEVDSRIRSVATQDGRDTIVAEEKEGGSAGVAVTVARARSLSGFDYRAVAATGDKAVRANQFRSQAESGNVALVRGRWCEDFLQELEGFPNGEYLDQVDAASHAFNLLVTGARPVQRLKVAWG